MASMRVQNAFTSNGSSSSSSSGNSTPRWERSVILSFRSNCDDTHNNFVNHLHKALYQHGIYAYNNDVVLEKRYPTSPELLKAIEQSRFSIVIISENYAFSNSCLDELVKIGECVGKMGQTVVPIFYHVDPSDVKQQKGVFEKAFAQHEEIYKKKTGMVQSWREALTKVASVPGWDVRDSGDEFTLIQQIVGDISSKLFCASSRDTGDLVGMDTHIKLLNSLLCIGLDDVRMVGIWGMGGIGKTTIARVIYNQLSSQFEGRCFLSNVKENFRRNGPSAVQNQLLSEILSQTNPGMCALKRGFNMVRGSLCWKKVLIVLDDVDNLGQLEILARKRDWFGPGSRIIITTREKHLLIAHGVNNIYEAKNLESDQALKLFKQCAFKQNLPTTEYLKLAEHVVSYAKGLPLALKVLGSFLCGRARREWESALGKLERNPNSDVQNVLRISYDGLDDEQKDIFLDIVCFFNWKKKDHVTEILDGCGFYTDLALSVLVEKSLITISDDELSVHDLLQEMGWEIVRLESIKELGKRSRLWIPEDVFHVLTEERGSRKVEGIFLDLSKIREMNLSSLAFSKMHNLRLLKFYVPEFFRGYIDTNKVRLPEGLKFLSDKLRYLHWHRYPSQSLPSSFSPDNLVELNLPYSNIEQLWEADQHLVNLKQIDLSHCKHLLGNINLSGATNLERIILDGCTSLVEAPSAIPGLKKLNVLCLKECRKLTRFPSTIHLKCLTTLELSGCSGLTKFPEISQNVLYLSMGGTAIEELPSSIECLYGLRALDLQQSSRLQALPSSICKLKSLYLINLSGCSKLESFPEITETMQRLESLHLDGTAIKELPASIEHLNGLLRLQLDNCKNLATLSSSICTLESLEEIHLSGCSKLVKLPHLSVFSSFLELHLSGCNLSEIPESLERLSSLRFLNLSRNNLERIPAGIKKLCELKYLILVGCRRLKSLPELPPSVEHILAYDCTSLEMVSVSCCLIRPNGLNYRHYNYTNCFMLTQNSLDNIVANVLLKIQLMEAVVAKGNLQGHFSLPQVRICVPGSEIPEMFKCRGTGSSVTIRLPSHWYNNKFIGLASCAVFAFKDYSHYGYLRVRCECHFKTNDDISGIIQFRNGSQFKLGEDGIRLDHIFLGYDAYLDREVKGDYWLSNCGDNEVSFQFKIVDEFGNSLPHCEVKKCGISLVYAQDKNEYSGNFNQPCAPYENGGCAHEDPVEPITEESMNLGRCYVNYCDQHGAETIGRESGNGRSADEEEEPHPKKMKETQDF